MKNKGFTLIELLAVIIILGILMMIAIPSVSKYVASSRKEGYIATANSYVKGALNLINSGKYDVFNPNTTYYIPISCIKLESGGDSPFGKFKDAYVLVNYDNDNFDFYWASTDVAGNGILITRDEDLSINRIRTGIKEIDTTSATDGRYTTTLMDGETCEFGGASDATNRFGELHFVPAENYTINMNMSFNFDDLEDFDVYTRRSVTGPYVFDFKFSTRRSSYYFNNSPLGMVTYMGENGYLKTKAFGTMPTTIDKKTGETVKVKHLYFFEDRKIKSTTGEEIYSVVCHMTGTGKVQTECWERAPVKLSYCRKNGDHPTCIDYIDGGSGEFIELANGDAIDISRTPPMRWYTMMSGYHNSSYSIDSIRMSWGFELV